MDLVLLRHGIAVSRDDPACPPDPQRELTARGVRRTAQVVRGLHRLGVSPRALLTSPYTRARQTAALAARGLGVPQSAIVVTDALRPGSSPGQALAEMRRRPVESLLCVSHSPELEHLLSTVLGVESRGWIRFKKAGAALVRLGDGEASNATLVWLLEPRVLRLAGVASR